MRGRRPAPPQHAPRGSLRLLGDPTFGPFFAGRLLSTAGVWIHNIAAAIVVYDLTRSATWVGAVSIAQFAPQLVLTPWSGARADTGDRRRQLIAGRLVGAAGSAGLALWIAAGGLSGTAGAVAVVGAAFVVGVGFSLGGPAMHALVPSLVSRPELPAAIALSSMPITLARAAGPALGALLVTGAGPAWAFAVAALGNALFAAALVLIEIREDGRVRPRDPSIRGGLRHVRTDPAIAALLVGAATIGMGTDPVITLTPSIADAYGAGERLVGALASAFGVGSAIGFLVLTPVRTRAGLPRLGAGGLVLLAAGLGALALSPVPATALAALVLAGVGMTFSLTAFTTQIQQRVPEEVRGRVMALWSVAFLGTRPLAAGFNGAVADAASVQVALAAVVVIILLGAVITRPSRVAAVGSD